MNMPIKFDTLEYARRLVEAGIPADQAEAQANALSDVLSEATVGPSELVLLRTDMTSRIEMLRIDIYAKLKALEESFNAKLEAFEEGFNAKLEALEERFNAKLEALEERFNAKLEALEQRLITKFNAKITTLYWMAGISMALHAVTIAMLVKIIDRLP
jgi:Skp family chaperone for outer membrane proteins